MPVSKRDKKVSLTKTSKKGREMKQQIIEKIRDHLNDFKSLYVFKFNNMRTGPLQEVRDQWKDSRFFYAKKKVMALALGRSKDGEMGKNLHKLAAYLRGQCGLLFTNQPKDYVVQWFSDYSKIDYARSGFIPTETVILPAGPLEEFSFSIEPRLRQLGMPTQLQKGIIHLREDFTVCTEGQKLTPEQADILVLINKPMAEFKISLICRWSSDGTFEKFKVPKDVTSTLTESVSIDKIQKENTKKFTSGKESFQEDHTTTNIPLVENTSTNHENVSLQQITDPAQQNDMPKKINKKPKSNEPETVMKEVKGTNGDVTEISSKQQDSPKKVTKTPKRTSRKTDTNLGTPMDVESSEEIVEPKELQSSPVLGRGNPRRSMRTPKPIKRTPEQKKMSVKRLTESSTPKQMKGTPKRTTERKRTVKMSDIDMKE